MISTVILARMLVPADYGLVAMAATISELLFLITSFGFETALIQRKDTSDADFNTVWTLNIVFGIIVGLLMIVGAPVSAKFFAEPRLEAVMIALAFSPIIGGLANVGIVLFRKNLEFNKDAILIALKRVAGFVVTLVAAFLLRDYWALVIGTLTTTTVGVVLSFSMHRYRPRFDLSQRKILFSFSFWLFLNNVIRFTNSRALDFLIARLSGAHAVGLFSTANEISSLPTSELSAPINRALFPGYSKLQDNDAELRKLILDVYAVLGVVAVPAGFGIVAVASPLVSTLLGERWLETIPLIQLLGIAGVIAVMQNNSYLVYLAKGRPRVTTWIAGSFAILQAAFVIALLPTNGVLGAAIAVLICRLIYIPIEIGMLLRVVHATVSSLLAVLYRPLISGLVMAGSLVAIEAWLLGLGKSAPLRLCVEIISGAVFYVVNLLLLWKIAGSPPGGERMVMKMFPNSNAIERFFDKVFRNF